MTELIRDNPADSRYEFLLDGEQVGVADYELSPGRVAFTHTEVDPARSGQGLAGRLVRFALDDAARRGLAVLPYCPYVRRVIAEHADEYLALVPEAERGEFGLAG